MEQNQAEVSWAKVISIEYVYVEVGTVSGRHSRYVGMEYTISRQKSPGARSFVPINFCANPPVKPGFH